jgi:two-component system chemotaxis response regulator CheY
MAMQALVVDDSSTMRRILTNVLKDVGIEQVSEAVDGVEAVSAAGNQDFNLILMDWNMPNMTGYEALKKIRESGKTMPIVMVTTEAEKSRVLEALKAGATNYIIKPFKSDAVAAKLKEVLG